MINPMKRFKEYYKYRKTLKEMEFVNREDIFRYIDEELKILSYVINYCHDTNLSDCTIRYFEGQRTSLEVLRIHIKEAKTY